MTAATDQDIRAAIAVTRFGLGARAGEIDAARSDPQGFLRAQIGAVADQPPGDLPSGATLFTRAAQARSLARKDADPAQALRVAQAARRQILLTEIAARTVLQVATPAAFRERWALFWSNHFSVSTTKDGAFPIVGAFEREAIRPHVFGRFEDLLVASTRHPAMLIYLDQQRSAGPDSRFGRTRKLGLNENLAREIMELHTVGLDAGYTQADVTEFARALTGWSMNGGDKTAADAKGQPGEFLYRPYLHQPGARTVLGRTYPEGEDGQARAILADLARHPATARHIAEKLGRHFVADAPPPALTRRLEAAFSRSNGHLGVVAEALIAAPESWAPAPAKLKTPYEFMISAYRAIGAPPSQPDRFAGLLNQLGQRPFAAPSPKGWPDTAADWAASGAILKRMAWAELFGKAASDALDPNVLAEASLGARLGGRTRIAVRRSESRPEAIALLLMSPEFQRR